MFIDDNGNPADNLPRPARIRYLSYNDDYADSVNGVLQRLLYDWRTGSGKGVLCTVKSLLGENTNEWNHHLHVIYNKCIDHHHRNGEENNAPDLALQDALQFMDWHIFDILNTDNSIDFRLVISEVGCSYICLDDPPSEGIDFAE